MARRPLPRQVFITGASSGIGRALALEYAAPGRHLGLVARRAAELAATAEACRDRGAEVWWQAADVTDGAAMRGAAEAFLGWSGAVELIIANAGGGEAETLLDGDLLDRTLRLNVTGVARTWAPFLPALRPGAQLAAVASLAGYRGLPYSASYSAAKAALINYAESLRIALRPRGIAVATICPGYVDTPLTAGNPFRPGVITAQQAAAEIRRQLCRGRSRIAFPWKLAWVVASLRFLPDALYDRAIAYFTARRAQDRAGR
ncbi:MAG: SDR family NAD(P)-dependent oxidoreductase [Terriglobales bacterium]